MAFMGNWAFLVYYLGIVIGLSGIFRILSPEQKRQYQPWFIASMVLIGLALLMTVISRFW